MSLHSLSQRLLGKEKIMANVNMLQVINGYREIAGLEREARKRRTAVAAAVRSGRISSSAMAELIGVTASAVDQMVTREKARELDAQQ